eukprot:TRINITY_DN103116_c0_g1_i1.p1 TRINITY_DN103116_c0_g1~~TRINITY_DN103116_c0_g1_i1.p1  ORF type:complete len:184 (-),score=70.81 TRINITY_DN103116_c0_g1_i1:263-814(-)
MPREASRRGSNGAAKKEKEQVATPVYAHVRQGVLEELKRRLAKEPKSITRDDIAKLVSFDDAEDSEVLIPVDIRGRLNRSAEALDRARREPSFEVEEYVKAAELFAANPEGIAEAQRPKKMTAKDWRNADAFLESDDDEEEGMVHEGELGEEEELELDEEVDLGEDEPEDEAAEEPKKKRQKR